MRRFYTLAGILSISDEEQEQIKELAAKGDPVACYKLAQIYLYLHNCDDYFESAHKLLQTAQSGGVADADAAIATMMLRGEIEPYDPISAVKLLEKSINNNSVGGILFQLRNLLYGRYGYKQNIELVKTVLNARLSQDEEPHWCALMGDVLMLENKIEESQEWYEKAVAGGENSVYGDLALARGINNEGNFKDYEAYCDTLMEGNDAMDPMCMYYLVLDKILEYDPDSDPETLEEVRDLVIRGLELNIELSHPMSFELLGDVYREGKMDIPIDLQKAWGYYVEGSQYMNSGCFEKMYDMLEADEIQLGNMSNEEAMDLCMINGARLHNTKLLTATVEAYNHGRLTRFAREIEMYHIPSYNALPDDNADSNEEEQDDDGRYDAWS